ncbi:hypothetical protein LbFV_ORF54 [Leptopilina boulardi filamentous virus]|uniref:Uncharacterized protein n=1 Tax=Leptopilina boulardi filamentous virus TaxID=552509 RepID=A0A1S5YDA7_9VIRU|nr:hypothetical protein LbFV_ORF54 [Leptopilina boulardi filamentous virus]AQQ79974.1 hypothetical protein LbFV_ORF54 [Leptopilina boulardi filamentous virus]
MEILQNALLGFETLRALETMIHDNNNKEEDNTIDSYTKNTNTTTFTNNNNNNTNINNEIIPYNFFCKWIRVMAIPLFTTFIILQDKHFLLLYKLIIFLLLIIHIFLIYNLF